MSNTVQIKVCGMRDPANIEALAKLPIDLMGFIFYPKSPRAVKGDALEKWLHQQGQSVRLPRRVGVFVNAPIEDVLNRVHDFSLDYVQLHGTESPSYCRELRELWSLTSMSGAQLIKAFSVGSGFDFSEVEAYAPFCAYALFDTQTEGFGGSGESFDWSLLAAYSGSLPFFLSGGLGPDQLEAIRAFRHPRLAGLDLNSRFEEKPGLKNVEALQNFVSTFIKNKIE